MQATNHVKSDIFFSSNTLRIFKRLVKNAFNIKQSQIVGNYLGLPSSYWEKFGGLIFMYQGEV